MMYIDEIFYIKEMRKNILYEIYVCKPKIFHCTNTKMIKDFN